MKNFIDRRLNRPYIRFVCSMILAIFLITFALSWITSLNGRTVFGPQLGADFGAFYVGGKIFNEYGHDRIYDQQLHQQLYLEMFPYLPADSRLPYVNAPFFIIPFVILAHLPYKFAYLFWVSLSIALYVDALAMLRSTSQNIPEQDWSTAFLLALSFMPFLVECLAGGQTTAFGFFFLAAAIALDRRGWALLSGVALAFCAYKPTLLLLAAPMLLITRRWISLLGLLLGVLLLSGLSMLLVGWNGCVAFVKTILSFANATAGAVTIFKTWKYVDVNAFFRGLLGNHPFLRWTLTGATFLIGLAGLFMAWWRLGKSRERTLSWALVLIWTTVLNVYLGIYDSSIVVLSALLMTDFLYGSRGREKTISSNAFKFLLLLLFFTPWFTQPVARVTGLQIFTLVLASFGIYQMKLAERVTFLQVITDQNGSPKRPN